MFDFLNEAIKGCKSFFKEEPKKPAKKTSEDPIYFAVDHKEPSKKPAFDLDEFLYNTDPRVQEARENERMAKLNAERDAERKRKQELFELKEAIAEANRFTRPVVYVHNHYYD